MKYNRLTDLMNVTCAEKEEMIRKNDALSKSNEQLTGQCREIRKRYETIL
jgi:hypothetical protein